MLEILEMQESENDEMLRRVGYGHFACSRDNQPYVVPIHYAYDKPYVYIYTTDGMKTEIIRSNPQVCLQVEELLEDGNWRSVVVMGQAEQITIAAEREAALQAIMRVNPTLSPAIAIRWRDNWIRPNVEVIYRVKPLSVTGRSSTNVMIAATAAKPGTSRSQ